MLPGVQPNIAELFSLESRRGSLQMNTFSLLRQARDEMTRLIPVADRFIFSVFDEDYHQWRDYGPYNWSVANQLRHELFHEKVIHLIEEYASIH